MAKKKKGTQLAAWEQKLADMATEAENTERNVGGGGERITVSGGQLQFQGASIPGNKLNVVILDHIVEYVYYADRYDPDNPAPPTCYALGRDEDTLRWSDDSDPAYAGELCKDSDINQWGSADTGRGKAAKNTRRLIMIPEEDLEDVENAEVAVFKPPVTSVKNWARYVRQIADQYKRPPLGVLTELSVVPNAKTQYEVQFRLLGTIDSSEDIEALIAKREAVQSQLFAPYNMSREDEDDSPAPRKKVGGGVRKSSVKKSSRVTRRK